MTVGQLAGRTGVSPYTLRYYEREGLVPGVLRESNGHRCYTREHIFWVAFLRRLRATGMTISEMKEYAALVEQGESTLAERQALLGRHRQKLDTRIRELKDNLELLKLKENFYRECEQGACRDDFVAYLEKHGRAIDGAPLDDKRTSAIS